MAVRPVLLEGAWRPAQSTSAFSAENPATGERLPDDYPVSSWADCDAALGAACEAARFLRTNGPDVRAALLEELAQRIEGERDALVEVAHQETGLPVRPRLAEAELPRTTNQLRQAAAAAREGSWALPTLDTAANIRSLLEPLGPVCVFGPNNFPFAFNSVAGGDFAAAIAAGNPVIAKANSSHPGTSRVLGELALQAVRQVGAHPATVQLLYRTSHADGERLVSDPRTGAIAYTGSRQAGLQLKAAADKAGKPIYLELSSVNPVLVLPGALAERGAQIAEEFTASCLMGTGQFCTNPGLVVLLAGPASEALLADVAQRFAAATPGVLLSRNVAQSLAKAVAHLQQSRAEVLAGGAAVAGPGFRFANTLLRVSGRQFLQQADALQEEAFGNASLYVVCADAAEAAAVFRCLAGNLTGCIYSARDGRDDALYAELAPELRCRVGRLLNDKMPTGVAVSPAMNHGGPYPATGHPGFTAVGIPASLRRFAMLACYDAVRAGRLPPLLQDQNPGGRAWRCIDGRWTQADVAVR